MGQEEAASVGRFASCFAPARKNPNGTDGRRAPCAWPTRAHAQSGARTAPARKARAGARAIRAKQGRAAGRPTARTERNAMEDDMQDADGRHAHGARVHVRAGAIRRANRAGADGRARARYARNRVPPRGRAGGGNRNETGSGSSDPCRRRDDGPYGRNARNRGAEEDRYAWTRRRTYAPRMRTMTEHDIP